jgi:hypothetical protein
VKKYLAIGRPHEEIDLDVACMEKLPLASMLSKLLQFFVRGNLYIRFFTLGGTQ